MVDSAGIVQYKTAQHSTTLLCRESCHLVHHLQLYKPFNTFHNKTSTIQSNMELNGSNTKTVCVLIHTHTHAQERNLTVVVVVTPSHPQRSYQGKT